MAVTSLLSACHAYPSTSLYDVNTPTQELMTSQEQRLRRSNLVSRQKLFNLFRKFQNQYNPDFTDNLSSSSGSQSSSNMVLRNQINRVKVLTFLSTLRSLLNKNNISKQEASLLVSRLFNILQLRDIKNQKRTYGSRYGPRRTRYSSFGNKIVQGQSSSKTGGTLLRYGRSDV